MKFRAYLGLRLLIYEIVVGVNPILNAAACYIAGDETRIRLLDP